MLIFWPDLFKYTITGWQLIISVHLTLEIHLKAVCPLERMKIRSIKISIEYPTRVRLFALSKVSKVTENQ